MYNHHHYTPKVVSGDRESDHGSQSQLQMNSSLTLSEHRPSEQRMFGRHNEPEIINSLLTSATRDDGAYSSQNGGQEEEDGGYLGVRKVSAESFGHHQHKHSNPYAIDRSRGFESYEGGTRQYQPERRSYGNSNCGPLKIEEEEYSEVKKPALSKIASMTEPPSKVQSSLKTADTSKAQDETKNYMEILKQEHNEYEDKLKQIQRKIMLLKAENQAEPTYTSVDELRNPKEDIEIVDQSKAQNTRQEGRQYELKTKKIEESDILDFSGYEKELKLLDDRYEPKTRERRANQGSDYPGLSQHQTVIQHSLTKEGTSPQMFDHLDTLKTFDQFESHGTRPKGYQPLRTSAERKQSLNQSSTDEHKASSSCINTIINQGSQSLSLKYSNLSRVIADETSPLPQRKLSEAIDAFGPTAAISGIIGGTQSSSLPGTTGAGAPYGSASSTLGGGTLGVLGKQMREREQDDRIQEATGTATQSQKQLEPTQALQSFEYQRMTTSDNQPSRIQDSSKSTLNRTVTNPYTTDQRECRIRNFVPLRSGLQRSQSRSFNEDLNDSSSTKKKSKQKSIVRSSRGRVKPPPQDILNEVDFEGRYDLPLQKDQGSKEPRQQSRPRDERSIERSDPRSGRQIYSGQRPTGKFDSMNISRVTVPSYARQTLSGVAKTIDESDLEGLDKAKEVANNYTRADDDAQSEVLPHSKYRLFQLERKFEDVSAKSKDTLQQMKKKVLHLEGVNIENSSKIRTLDIEKKETFGNIARMHDRLKHLNHRLKSQSDLSKMKEDRHIEKIELLERRVALLNEEIRAEKNRTNKAKPLPFEKYKKVRSHSRLSGVSSTKNANSGVALRSDRKSSRRKSRGRSSKRSNSNAPTSPFSHQNMLIHQEAEQDVDLRIKSKQASSRGGSRRSRSKKAPLFVPLRGQKNQELARNNRIKNPEPGYKDVILQQDKAKPDEEVHRVTSTLGDPPMNDTTLHLSDPYLNMSQQRPATFQGQVQESSLNRVHHTQTSAYKEYKNKSQQIRGVENNSQISRQAFKGGQIVNSSSKSQMTFGDAYPAAAVPEKQQTTNFPQALPIPSNSRQQKKEQSLSKQSKLSHASREYAPLPVGGRSANSSSAKRGEQRIDYMITSNTLRSKMGDVININCVRDTQQAQIIDKMKVVNDEEMFELAPNPFKNTDSKESGAVTDSAHKNMFDMDEQKQRVPTEKSEISNTGGQATPVLQSMVMELANQVRSLHGLVAHEIEDKNNWRQRAETLEQKYFASLDALKDDVLSFKNKLAHENKQIYSELSHKINELSDVNHSSQQLNSALIKGDKGTFEIISGEMQGGEILDPHLVNESLSAKKQIFEQEERYYNRGQEPSGLPHHPHPEEEQDDSLYQQCSSTNQEQHLTGDARRKAAAMTQDIVEDGEEDDGAMGGSDEFDFGHYSQMRDIQNDNDRKFGGDEMQICQENDMLPPGSREKSDEDEPEIVMKQ